MKVNKINVALMLKINRSNTCLQTNEIYRLDRRFMEILFRIDFYENKKKQKKKLQNQLNKLNEVSERKRVKFSLLVISV